jgi:hypothetical protein
MVNLLDIERRYNIEIKYTKKDLSSCDSLYIIILKEKSESDVQVIQTIMWSETNNYINNGCFCYREGECITYIPLVKLNYVKVLEIRKEDLRD